MVDQEIVEQIVKRNTFPIRSDRFFCAVSWDAVFEELLGRYPMLGSEYLAEVMKEYQQNNLHLA